MATIDSLDIQISAQASKASASLDALARKLSKVSTSLSGISGHGLANMSSDINRLASAMNGIKNLDFGNNAKQVSSMARALGSLNTINDASINNSAKAIKVLANSMKSVSGMDFGENPVKMAELARGLSALGGKAAQTAVTNIPKLANAMKQFMKTLSTAPKVSQNLINMTNAMANFAKTGASGGRAADALGTGIQKMGHKISGVPSIMKNFHHSSLKMTSGIKSLVSQIIPLGGLIGVFAGIKKSIDISSSLTEVQNVVDVTFGAYKDVIEDFAKISITDFGMSELTAKQIASRFQAMGTAIGFSQGKMADMSVELTKLAGDMASFYNVEQADIARSLQAVFTGEAEPLRRYGLDLTQVTLKEWALKNGLDANIQAMSQAEKTMLRYQYVMANTGAAQGDFARTADTWANQIRILKQNFQALASIIGGVFINALKPLVKALNAAMQVFINFAKVVSNSLGKIFGWTYEEGGGTGLTEDFEGAAGGAEDIADSTDKAAKNIKKIQKGIRAFDELKVINLPEQKDPSAGGGGGGAGDGGIGDIGEADGGKWKQGDSIIKSFESELNTLYKLGEYIGNKLSDAMASIDWSAVYDKARGFGTGLANFLNGLISPELFGNLGTTIAGALNTALHALDSFGGTFDWNDFGNSLKNGLVSFLKGIDWKTALSSAVNWSKGIADALNSFISPEAFGLVGESIGKAINTALASLNTFGSTFDWTNFGNSIATGINNFFKTTKLEDLAKTISAWVKGAFTSASTLLTETDFNQIGDKIAKFFNTIDWKGMVESAGKTVLAAATAVLNTFASFITKIDYAEIVSSLMTGLAKAISKADVGSLVENMVVIGTRLVKNMLGFDYIELVSKLVKNVVKTVYNHFKTSIEEKKESGESNGRAIIKGILSGILSGIKGIGKWIKDNIFLPIWNGILKSFGIADGKSSKMASIGRKIIYGIKLGVKEKYADVLTTLRNIWTKIKTIFANVKDFFSTTFGNAFSTVKSAFSTAKSYFLQVWEGIKSPFVAVASWFHDKFSVAWQKVKDVFSTGSKIFEGIKEGIASTFARIVNKIISGINNVIAWPFNKINSMLNKIRNTSIFGKQPFQNLWSQDPISIPVIPQISGYELGGFPEDGWFRASHGEMMGKFDNGQSVVANNKQITEGISIAVQNGNRENNALLRQEIAVLQQQNDILHGILNKEFGITKNDIGKAARDYSMDFYKRTGKPAYDF